MSSRSSPTAERVPLSLRLQCLSLLGIFVAVGSLAALAFGAGWFTDRTADERAAEERAAEDGATNSSGPLHLQPETRPGGRVAGAEPMPVSPPPALAGPPATDSTEPRAAADSSADQLLLRGDGAHWRRASTGERLEACRLAAEWLAPDATSEWQARRAAYYWQKLEALYGDPRWETVPLVELVPLLDATAQRDPD